MQVVPTRSRESRRRNEKKESGNEEHFDESARRGATESLFMPHIMCGLHVYRQSKRSFGINTTLVLLIWKRKGDKITHISRQYGHTIGMEYLSLPSHNVIVLSYFVTLLLKSKVHSLER